MAPGLSRGVLSGFKICEWQELVPAIEAQRLRRTRPHGTHEEVDVVEDNEDADRVFSRMVLTAVCVTTNGGGFFPWSIGGGDGKNGNWRLFSLKSVKVSKLDVNPEY